MGLTANKHSLQKLYYLSAVFAFHLIANNPFHPIYNYSAYFSALNLKRIDEKSSRLAALALSGIGLWSR